MNSKEIRDRKSKLSLTKEQKDVLVGLLLGDGHLETQNGGKTFRLKIEHGCSQIDYENHVYKLFKNWTVNKPKVKMRNSKPASVWFTTFSHGLLRFYGQQFYLEGKKRVPPLLEKMITEKSLAFWFMDDGSRKSSKHLTYNIHTLGYKHQDQKILQGILKRKFNLTTRLHKQKGKYWRIYIPSESAKRFKVLVEPFIIPSMKYKLGNTNA